MQMEMRPMPPPPGPGSPSPTERTANPQFSGDWESEPRAGVSMMNQPSMVSGGAAVARPPTPSNPSWVCTRPDQVIGVDESSPTTWSHDGTMLAFAARDFGIYVAMSEGGSFRVAASLVGSKARVVALQFNPHRSLLASGAEDGLKLWAVHGAGTGVPSSNNPTSQNRLLQSVDSDSGSGAHESTVEEVYWFLDGQFLATGSKDNTIRIWDLVETGSSGDSECSLSHLETIDAHKASVLSIAFSQHVMKLATTGRDSVIKVWDCTSLLGEMRERRKEDVGITCVLLHNMEGHRGDVISLAWSASGATIFSGARDNTIKVWDPRTGLEMRTLTGHKGDVHRLVILPDNRMLSAAADGCIKIWQLLPEQSDESLASSAAAAHAASLDVETLVKALLSDDAAKTDELMGADAPEDTLEASIEADPAGIMSCDISGHLLATYAESINAIQIWNVSRDICSPVMQQEFMGHREPVMQVLALSDGQIISAGGDQIINVFDTRSLARVACMEFGGAVNDLAVTPDESLLFAAGTERDIKGYDLRGMHNQQFAGTGEGNGLGGGGMAGGSDAQQPSVLLSGHCAKVFAIDVSSDGLYLASAAQDFDVIIWNLAGASTGNQHQPVMLRPAHRLEAHASAVSSLSFNTALNGADSFLALGGSDHCVSIWTISARNGSGKRKWSREDAHEHVVSAVCWGVGESSQLLFSGSWDHMLKVWKVGLNGNAGFEPMRTLSGHSHRIEDMVVADTGNALLSASWDSSVRLWQIGERAPIECICEYTREDYSEIFNCVATSKVSVSAGSGSGTMSAASGVVVGSADGMIHIFPLCPLATSGRGALARPDAFSRFEAIGEEQQQPQQLQQQRRSLRGQPVQAPAIGEL